MSLALVIVLNAVFAAVAIGAILYVGLSAVRREHRERTLAESGATLAERKRILATVEARRGRAPAPARIRPARPVTGRAFATRRSAPTSS